MIEKTVTIGNTTIPYFVHGLNPKLLIHAAIHGDEAETGTYVEMYIHKHIDTLPDFVFVPQVSPSAIVSKTRVNGNGKDLNRMFFLDTTDEEAQANMELVKNFHFDLLISFHEDVEFSQFYMYDSVDRSQSNAWKNIQSHAKNLGVSLLTGIDDPTDPALNYEFIDGYCHCPKSDDTTLDGTFENWAIQQNIIHEWIMPEIPRSVKSSIKKSLISVLFENLPSFLPKEKTIVLDESELSNDIALAL